MARMSISRCLHGAVIRRSFRSAKQLISPSTNPRAWRPMAGSSVTGSDPRRPPNRSGQRRLPPKMHRCPELRPEIDAYTLGVNENIRWKADFPGLGHSSPCICVVSIFLTSADKDNEGQLVIADDRTDGHICRQNTRRYLHKWAPDAYLPGLDKDSHRYQFLQEKNKITIGHILVLITGWTIIPVNHLRF